MEPFPDTLHSRIIRKLFLEQSRLPLIVITSVIVVSGVISGWYAYLRMVDLETMGVMRAMWEGAEFSKDFWGDFSETFFDIMPSFSLSIFFINVSLLSYIIYSSIKVTAAMKE